MFRIYLLIALLATMVAEANAQLVPFFDKTYAKDVRQVEVVSRPDGSRCTVALVKNDSQVGDTVWLDPLGNVISTKQTLVGEQCNDMAAEYNSATGKMDVYQAGYTGSQQHGVVVAANEDGIKWRYEYTPADGRSSYFQDMVVTQDYIYLIGTHYSMNESNNALLVVLDKSGNKVRDLSYNTAGTQLEWGKKLAVDAFGNTYLLIDNADTLGGFNRLVMVAHYANGNFRFAKQANIDGHSGSGVDIATDGFRVYTTYNYGLDENNYRGRIQAFAIFAQDYAWSYTFLPSAPLGGANYIVGPVRVTADGNYIVFAWYTQGPAFKSLMSTTYFTPSGTPKMTCSSTEGTGGPTKITNMVMNGNTAFVSGDMGYNNTMSAFILRTSYDGVTGTSHQATYMDESGHTEGKDVAVDNRGNAVLIGRSGFLDGYLRKFIFGIDSVTLTPTSVVGGNTVHVAVHTSEIAPQFGFGIDMSSTSGLTGDAFVMIGTGQDSTSWDLETKGVDGDENIQVDASMSPGNKLSANLTLKPATLQGLSFPGVMFSGSTFNGLVLLTGQAGLNPINVALSDNSSAITIPASVQVPGRESSAIFQIQTAFVSTTATRQITATYGGVTKSRNLTLEPGLKTFSVNPTTVVSGDSTTGTITLYGAPTNGGTAYITSNSSSIPSQSATISGGSAQASFPIATYPINATVTRIVTVTLGSVSRGAYLTLTPGPMLINFTMSPSPVNAGQIVQAFAYLSMGARPGGTKVNLSSDSSVIMPPAFITVPGGATSAGVVVNTGQVSQTTVRNVTATYGGKSIRKPLTINPSPVLRALSISPATVKGGNPSAGTATLWGPAPGGGKSVALSDNSGSISEPASVLVAAGATTAQFAITTTAVSAQATRTITAQLDGVTKTANITLTP